MARYTDDDDRNYNSDRTSSGHGDRHPSDPRKSSGDGVNRRDSYYDDRRSSGTAYRSSGNSSRTSSSSYQRSGNGSSRDDRHDDAYRSSGSGTGNRRPDSHKKGSRKAKAQKKRRHIIMFVVEMLVLVVMVIILYGVLKVTKTGKVNINDSDIVINSGVAVPRGTPGESLYPS